ncbi:DUF1697 domain-containing protein [Gordonia sp. HY002]|uniref:DUF1697 domain-containing protein n=1 Tax=Gordonia zhenghanii TaxID=2911516 RepID=UPI001EF07231|nr:DUF1697 domain-containing protein [Gordonia zhenghanii]MCF8572193.1 DUF1697 domain-containing protein [Gordonia zhenghanii]MCF8607797.1 DUF1697 domain-containing protein [Gordonia zhenghanii]
MPASRIVLIRAVNVGGTKLPMVRLRQIATELGADDVSTYIASGNLLCTPPGDPTEFDRALEQAISAEFGYFREVISRTPDEIAAALAAFAFGDAAHGHLYFLTGTPNAAAADEFCARDFGNGERLAVIGRDLHIDYRNGAGATKLTPKLIERALGVTGTGRNLRTSSTLVERART